VLPQALGLAGELTLAENTALPLLLTGSSEARSRSVAVLAELGVGDLADRYPNEVSYGQQQRAALARAIVVEPDVLLADEPTAHVDQASAEVVLTVLRRVADRGTAVIAATHDPRVHAVADRRLRLDKGRLVA
jgi:putative ABC transport system ATP-binding protein